MPQNNEDRVDEFDSMPETGRDRQSDNNNSGIESNGASGTGAVESEQAMLGVQTDLLGTRLTMKWSAWSNARTEQEDQWLKNIRQFKSIYEAAIGLNIGKEKSRIYLQITSKKVLESYAHQINTFFPGSGIKHWSIKSTPVPELESRIQTPEAKEELSEIIKANTKKMAKLIEHQLCEADYPSMFRCATLDSTIMGSGIIVSAEVGIKNGQVFPKIRYMNPFDGYPDPDAINRDSMSGFFERMVISRKEFRDLSR